MTIQNTFASLASELAKGLSSYPPISASIKADFQQAESRFRKLLFNPAATNAERLAASAERRAFLDLMEEAKEGDIPSLQHSHRILHFKNRAEDYAAVAETIIREQEADAPSWFAKMAQTIGDATKEALGLSGQTRAEKQIERDKKEEEVRIAEENLVTARLTVKACRTNPCEETVNRMIAAVSALQFKAPAKH